MLKSILLVMYGWNEPGGGTKLPRSIAVEFVRRGYRVAVFYASLRIEHATPPYSLEEHVEDGVRLFGLYNRPALFIDADNPDREMNDPQVVERFRQVLDEIRPDLVHYHNFHGLTLALAEETWRRRIPSCFSPHNYYMIDPELYLLKNGLELWQDIDPLSNSEAVARNPHLIESYRRRVEVTLRLMNEWVDCILASSRRQMELLVRYGAIPERFILAHQASQTCDDLWNNRAFSTKHSAKKRGALSLGVIGSLMPIKGVHIMVVALQEFDRGEVELHIYGTPVAGYQELLQSLDQKGCVHFHGEYTTDMLVDIAASLDIAVVSSVVEDCAPLTVLELHAMRLPVLAARIGGIPDFISDGVDGFLYDPYDIKGLIKIIRTMLDQPECVETMRRNLVYPSRTFSGYCDHIETLYTALSAGKAVDPSSFSYVIEPRTSRPERAMLRLHWEGGRFVHHSLALVNRELCVRLLSKDCCLSYALTEPDHYCPQPDSRLSRLTSVPHQPLDPPDITVRHFWPPDFSRPSHGKLVVIQPWEYGSIPSAWVGPINSSVDQVWVPTHFVRDCYLRGGVLPEKVRVIPNGVDIGRFHTRQPALPLATSKRFRFLFVGGTIHRKGIDLLLAAYAAAFCVHDDVCLVIKDMGTSSIYQGQTAQEMITAFQQVAHHPELLYLPGDMTDDLMPGLYTACHCLVHPYRGEGFGLPIAEAMASGLMPIVTSYGAALDYCSSDTAWLIPAHEQRMPVQVIGGLETVELPWFAEPDLDALTALMRRAYEQPDEVRRFGSQAAAYIRQHLTWEQAADKAWAALLQLQTPPQPLPEENHAGQDQQVVIAPQNTIASQAWSLFARGECDQAVTLLLEQGIRPDSSRPEPYGVLVEILLAAERYQDALDVIVEMPEATSLLQRAELELLARCGLGDDQQVLELAVHLVQKPRVQVALGTIAARRGALAEAERCFRQALAYDAGSAAAWRALTVLLWGRGDTQGTWSAACQAVLADPMHGAGLAIAVDIASRIQNQSQAVQIFGQLTEQYPGYRDVALQYARLLVEYEGGVQAVAAVERFLACFGMDDQLLADGLRIRQRLGEKKIVSGRSEPAISLCMIVKNEEQFLAGCLHSVQPIVDELILLDTGSTDRTVAIAQLFGATVGHFVWNGSFSDARNASLAQAHGDWILIMDADEQFSPQDHQAVRNLVRSSSRTDAWSVMIRTYSNRVQVQGWTANDGSYPAAEQADGWYPASRVRLFPRHTDIRYEGAVHELLEPALRRLRFEIRQAPFVVHHYAEVAGLPENLRAKQLRYYELGKQKLADSPGNLEALYELAVQAGELGLFEEALDLWDQLLTYSPGQLDALFNKGHILMNLKRYEAAGDLSRQVLQADPSRREAAFNYATCELYVGNIEMAYQLVYRYLEKDQDYPLLQALHVVLGLATNRIAEACGSYAALLAQQYAIQAYIGARLSVLRDLGRNDVADMIQNAAQIARLEIRA